METTAAVQTLTDELLGEIEAAAMSARKTFTCNSCHGVYVDEKVSSCDCMGAEIYTPGCAINADHAHVTALITELRTLRAENAELRKDAGRLDWLADLDSPAQVLLPSQFVLENIHSMRDAIDQCRTAIESTGVRVK